MTQTSLTQVHNIVWTALMAALIAAGAFINIPIGPVPISLQTMFLVCSGFLLGPRQGMLAVVLYLVAGFVGLPVFAGGAAGLGHLFGPTGGYLIGFIPCAGLSGMALRGLEPGKAPSWKSLFFWGFLGQLSVFVIGVPRLAMVIDSSLGKAFAVGMLPFMPGFVLKLIGACFAARFLHAKGLVRR